jgi:hypothetical protein
MVYKGCSEWIVVMVLTPWVVLYQVPRLARQVAVKTRFDVRLSCYELRCDWCALSNVDQCEQRRQRSNVQKCNLQGHLLQGQANVAAI